jgi:chemotaxis protein methyltransferase CheR
MILTSENTPNLMTHTQRLSKSEFEQLSKLVYVQCGINLTDGKGVMLESRLGKRLRALQISSFREYIQYVTSREGLEKELLHMIDAVATNKTDFFREPHHFEFLKHDLLPAFLTNSRPGKTFRVWSAACSTGEEAYTLAMVLQDFEMQQPEFKYSILASDISTQALQKAMDAVYNMDLVSGLPLNVKQRYLLKSRDTIKPTVRIVRQLRDKIQFMRMNLMDSAFDIDGGLDVIFCRNVLIYFDRKTQLEVVGKLAGKLRPGGHLFIGHSESLHNFDLPITQVKPTVFVKN